MATRTREQDRVSDLQKEIDEVLFEGCDLSSFGYRFPTVSKARLDAFDERQRNKKTISEKFYSLYVPENRSREPRIIQDKLNELDTAFAKVQKGELVEIDFAVMEREAFVLWRVEHNIPQSDHELHDELKALEQIQDRALQLYYERKKELRKREAAGQKYWDEMNDVKRERLRELYSIGKNHSRDRTAIHYDVSEFYRSIRDEILEGENAIRPPYTKAKIENKNPAAISALYESANVSKAYIKICAIVKDFVELHACTFESPLVGLANHEIGEKFCLIEPGGMAIYFEGEPKPTLETQQLLSPLFEQLKNKSITEDDAAISQLRKSISTAQSIHAFCDPLSDTYLGDLCKNGPSKATRNYLNGLLAKLDLNKNRGRQSRQKSK